MKRVVVFVFVIVQAFACVAQTHKRLTNLPHVYINTFDGKSVTSKTTYKYATMWMVDENDSVAQYDSLEIRGRGNSTWSSMGEKKPYKIKFNKKEKLLGKGYANCKPWTLMANTGDKALIRNAISSLMCDFFDMKNPPAHKFVDLTVNGDYRGNYMISDHVDVRPHRVNVEEQDYPLTEESNITGGYLLEVDGFHDGNCFASSNSVYIRIHYPDEDEIDASQNQYIRNYVNEFEAALFGGDFSDPLYGYRAYTDSASLVAWYLVNEITANIDGFYSSYFYKYQDNPKLYFGPCWDYDIAYNNDYRIQQTESKLMTENGYGDAKKWTQRMWKDDWFRNAVNDAYQNALDRGLVDYMNHHIDSLVALLDESQQLNYQKWGINTKRYHEIVLYSSYDQYIDYIKDFLTAHTAWLKTTFESRRPAEPEPEPEPTPEFEPEQFYYRIQNKGSATVFDLTEQDTVSGSICAWANTAERETQDWVIIKDGEYYRITTRHGGMALSDSAEPGVTGVVLNIAEPDSTSDRQLWTIYPQGTEGYYNLLNKYTSQGANLSGGNKSNGANIISYTSNERDATSNNRLWKLLRGDSIPQPKPEPIDTIPIDTIPIDTIPVDTIPVDTVPVGLDMPDAFDYALAYDQYRKILHFGSEEPSRLVFWVYIYDTQGRPVGRFIASEEYSVADLPRGVYMVVWQCEGRRRSVKFIAGG